MLIAGVLLGLTLGAMFMRRWLLSREPAIDIEPAAPTDSSMSATGIGIVPAAEPAPDVRFVARVDAGETTIEFTALSDIDETTVEDSREHHA